MVLARILGGLLAILLGMALLVAALDQVTRAPARGPSAPAVAGAHGVGRPDPTRPPHLVP